MKARKLMTLVALVAAMLPSGSTTLPQTAEKEPVVAAATPVYDLGTILHSHFHSQFQPLYDEFTYINDITKEKETYFVAVYYPSKLEEGVFVDVQGTETNYAFFIPYPRPGQDNQMEVYDMNGNTMRKVSGKKDLSPLEAKSLYIGIEAIRMFGQDYKLPPSVEI